MGSAMRQTGYLIDLARTAFKVEKNIWEGNDDEEEEKWSLAIRFDIMMMTKVSFDWFDHWSGNDWKKSSSNKNKQQPESTKELVFDLS